jgi:hypothetical protein
MHQDTILPKSIYYFFILIIILVLPIALGLIFLPQQTGPAFFWPLKPFNTRFLGFFYTAEMAAVGLLIKYNRWSPARFVITASFLFTLWATLLTLIYCDTVPFTKTWQIALWFGLYGGSCLITGWFLYLTREYSMKDLVRNSTLTKIILIVHSTLMGIHIMGLLMSPVAFSSNYWPWMLDAFSGRFYAALFALTLYGNYLMWKGAHAREYQTYGAVLVVFGLGAVAGLLLVDAQLHKVDWGYFGTWFWIGSSVISGGWGLWLMSPALRGKALSVTG